MIEGKEILSLHNYFIIKVLQSSALDFCNDHVVPLREIFKFVSTFLAYYGKNQLL